MEFAHSLCCEQCRQGMLDFVEDVAKARATAIMMSISPPRKPKVASLPPHIPNLDLCFHIPGLLASTPLVGMVARLAVVTMKMAPLIRAEREKPVSTLELIVTTIKRPSQGSKQRFFEDVFGPSIRSLNAFVSSNSSVIPYLLENSKLFDHIVAMRPPEEATWTEYSNALARPVHTLIVNIIGGADADSLAEIRTVARSHKQFHKLVLSEIHSSRDECVLDPHTDWGEAHRRRLSCQPQPDRVYGTFPCKASTEGLPLTIALPILPTLGSCGVSRFQASSRCKRINYCSTDCQKADWRYHKHVCGVERMPHPLMSNLVRIGGLKHASSSQTVKRYLLESIMIRSKVWNPEVGSGEDQRVESFYGWPWRVEWILMS